MRFQTIFTKRYYQISEEGNRLIKSKVAESSLSRIKLASLFDISDSYLDHLLRNDRNFREDELQKILPFLNINLGSGYFTPKNTIHGKFVRFPKGSSAKLMQIIGYLLGDGTVQPRTIRFKDTDRGVLKIYQKLIYEIFNVGGKVVPQKGTIAFLLEVNSVYLSKWLKENILSKKKEFLRKVEQLPSKEITAFLRGIFDAEGCVAVQSRQVKLGITIEEIGKAIHVLLSRLKIPSSFHKIKRIEPNWNDTYLNSLNSYSALDKFSKVIGYSSRTKAKKLNSVMHSYKRKNK